MIENNLDGYEMIKGKVQGSYEYFVFDRTCNFYGALIFIQYEGAYYMALESYDQWYGQKVSKGFYNSAHNEYIRNQSENKIHS